MLVDTDVLIWYLRGYAQASAALDQLPSFSISSVTHMEIVQGMRNKAELAAFKKMLVQRAAQHLPVTQAISNKAVDLMESMSLSHGLQMDDALIAATALEHQLTLLTGNTKHFLPIPQLVIETFMV